MKNGKEPAFPNHKELSLNIYEGLTKREYAAILAMQGLLANQGHFSTDGICKESIQLADHLLTQLSQGS